MLPLGWQHRRRHQVVLVCMEVLVEIIRLSGATRIQGVVREIRIGKRGLAIVCSIGCKGGINVYIRGFSRGIQARVVVLVQAMPVVLVVAVIVLVVVVEMVLGVVVGVGIVPSIWRLGFEGTVCRVQWVGRSKESVLLVTVAGLHSLVVASPWAFRFQGKHKVSFRALGGGQPKMAAGTGVCLASKRQAGFARWIGHGRQGTTA